MIFDALTHVTPNGRWYSTDYDASEDRLLKEMDASGVSKAVVTALAGYIENDFVLGVCQRHPDRLVPAASFNPAVFHSLAEVTREAKEQLRDQPFTILKLHPRFNRYDPLDPRCLALLEEVAAWHRPLHIWLCSLLHYQGGSLRKSAVDTLYEIAGRFPALKFVFLHAGGANLLALAEAIRSAPNVHLDLSHTIHRYRGSSIEQDIKYLLGSFDKRIIWGSDFPEASPGTVLEDFEALSSGQRAHSKELVLGGNLSGLLGGMQ